MMAENVRGPFNVAKAVFAEMKKNKRGKTINASPATVFSGTLRHAALRDLEGCRRRLHAVARAGSDFLRHFHQWDGAGPDMSEGLLNQRQVLEPFAKVAMTSRAIKREQLPDDLVGTLFYLASSDSDFMTGQTITVDGGYVMKAISHAYSAAHRAMISGWREIHMNCRSSSGVTRARQACGRNRLHHCPPSQ